MTPEDFYAHLKLPRAHATGLDPRIDYSQFLPVRSINADGKVVTNINPAATFTVKPTLEQFLYVLFMLPKALNRIVHEPHEHEDLLVYGYGQLWGLLCRPKWHAAGCQEWRLFKSLKRDLLRRLQWLRRHNTISPDYEIEAQEPDMTREQQRNLIGIILRLAEKDIDARKVFTAELQELLEEVDMTEPEFIQYLEREQTKHKDRQRKRRAVTTP